MEALKSLAFCWCLVKAFGTKSLSNGPSHWSVWQSLKNSPDNFYRFLTFSMISRLSVYDGPSKSYLLAWLHVSGHNVYTSANGVDIQCYFTIVMRYVVEKDPTTQAPPTLWASSILTDCRWLLLCMSQDCGRPEVLKFGMARVTANGSLEHVTGQLQAFPLLRFLRHFKGQSGQ